MKIIAFEGLDGSGKSVQTKRLYNYLSDKGFRVAYDGFHRYGTKTGKLIHAWLKGEYTVSQKTIELIMSADKQQYQDHIQWLKSFGYDYLILDRYKTSQLVYGKASGSDTDWLMSISKHCVEPDIEVFIDIDVDTSMDRSGRTDRYEKDREFLELVRGNYWSYFINHTGIFVDGHQTEYKVFESIIEGLEMVDLNLKGSN